MKGKQHAKTSTRLSAKERTDINIGYIYRTFEEQLNSIATQEGCPYSVTDLALRFSTFLHDTAVREALGNPESLRSLRGATTETRTAKLAKDLDVASRPKRTLSAAGLKAMRAGQKRRWAKWRKQHSKQHRKHTPAQLRAFRANAVKARAALAAKVRKAA